MKPPRSAIMSSSVEKNDVTHHDSERSDLSDSPGHTAKVGKGAKLKRHCMKWWWVHLIIFIVVVLVVLLPL